MAEASKIDDDDDMNLEERMAWLRERGVLVETPEERKRGKVVAAMRLADTLGAEISYVLVPADTSKPLQELTFQSITGIPGDLLIEHLKSAFSKKSDENVDVELLKSQATQTLTGSADTPGTVSDAALQQVAAEANVESFSLVHPIPANNFTGINIYLDEVGMLKRLPLNKRASDFAARAGFNPAPTFYGNVFLGRVQQKPALKNVSFLLGADTAPDAPWMKAATTENLEYQMEMNRITGRSDLQQPGVAGGDGKSKEEDGYTWTQTEEELEIIVLLPSDAISKQIAVKFFPKKVTVSYQKESKISLQLFERMEMDACTWTLEKGSDDQKKLVITMEKLEQAFWPRICD